MMKSQGLPSDLGEKLIFILEKLKSSDLNVLDDVFLGKVLTGFRNELTQNTTNKKNLEVLIRWLSNKDNFTNISLHVLVFLVQLTGIISENEELFIQIHDSVLNILLDHVKFYINKNANLKLSYITLLSNIVNHKSGCEWVLKMKLCKQVVEMYLAKPGLFIEREAITFLTKLLENIDWDNEVYEEILKHILLPLHQYRKEFEMKRLNEKNSELFQRRFEAVGIPVLHAYTVILETWIVNATTKRNFNYLQSTENEPFWKFLLETNSSDTLLEKVSIAYTLQSICVYCDMDCLLPEIGLPDCIFEIFKILLKRKKISNVIKLAKYCQLFWNKITLNITSSENGLENHFIIIQLIPALLLLKKPKKEDCLLDIFIDKLSDLTGGNTLRLCYLIRDVVKYEDNGDSVDFALQAVLSVSKNMETLNLDRAVLIFQALANILRTFIPRLCDFDDPITEEEFKMVQMLCHTRESLLFSILNSICGLIEKFKINWTEALESLCLLKISSMLLNNPNLSPRLAVATLSLIKLAIVNFMAPNMVLLVDKIEGTSLECLINILYSKMHDPNWEVRDSCVEVIGIIAELAKTKYPLFRDFLIRGNYCELILNMIDGDSESYVRSSSLKALSQMIRIENLRNRYLNNVDLTEKITLILRNESEGIVRREAALLAKELFEHHSSRSNSLMNLYLIMGYAATSDLHWEVKVNSLIFWEKVIEEFIADQGMIDGFFPSITFSKDNKKIVSLTDSEIKARLHKVLVELSDIGCLHVLIATLKDDYDFQVVQKSAQILTYLLEMLKRYDLFEKESSKIPKSDKCSMKRKSSDEIFPDKKINHVLTDVREEEENEINKSSRIIEDIVNEIDLNLLGNVYNPNSIISSPKVDCIPLKIVKPEVFLREIQNLDINSFVNNKRKWLLNTDDDLNELVNDILTLSIECETNVMDCY